MAEAKVDIRVKVKATNLHLAKLVDRFGTITAVAEELGICKSTFSQWLNFKTQLRVYKTHAKRQAKILLKLCELCEASPEEIFPDLSKDQLQQLYETRSYDTSVSTEALTYKVEQEHMGYTPREFGEAMDQREVVAEALKTLPQRLAFVLELRFGLGGGAPMTLGEVGKCMGLTQSRVRQLEHRALCMLDEDSRRKPLSQLLDPKERARIPSRRELLRNRAWAEHEESKKLW